MLYYAVFIKKGLFMKRHHYALFIACICSITIMQSMSIGIGHLTLDQKIGQLFMVAAVVDEVIAKNCISRKSYRLDKEYIAQLITQYQIGGIIFLGKSDPDKQKERTAYFQSVSVIPLLIGQDLEPGRVGVARLELMRDFADNETLGTINSEKLTYETAFSIGRICKDLGVHINCAPVADVNNNPNNPVINDRSFSGDPEVVAKHAIAFAHGLSDAGIIACAKHFPGHGDTDVDSHYDLPKIAHDRERLHTIELYPFKQLIASNVPAIMMGHLAVSAFEPQRNLPSSLSKNIVTKLLREELGFNGLIITDALDMRGVTRYYSHGQAELQALLAGNDILLCPVDVPAAVAAIKQAIKDGRLLQQ